MRIEAPMNATYTVPDPNGAPAMRIYDGTAGLFGANNAATKDATALPTGSNLGNGFTVLSATRAGPGADGYANGDFNYDGVIDGGDYGIIDNNSQAQGAPFPTSGVASLALLLVPLAGLMRRRARRRNLAPSVPALAR